jgi:hypothetical protein
VTSQGSPSGRFQKAIERGNLFQAELAAREMKQLALGQAFQLCLLMGRAGDPRYARAAVRWHGRFVTERKIVRLSESQLVLASLAELQQDPEVAEQTLRQIARRYGLR